MAKKLTESIYSELLNRMPKKILCSPEKKEGYAYEETSHALMCCNFIQYNTTGNLHFLSLDVDFKRTDEEIHQICLSFSIPFPTVILQTTKGIHLHWFLENFISKNKENVIRYYKDIRMALEYVFGADVHARGCVRVFRNPLLHLHLYNPMAYGLNDFKEALGYLRSKIKKPTTVNRTKRRSVRNTVDFSKVSEGARNVTMFTYLRTFGYTVWGAPNRLALLTNEADFVNSKMSDPLPMDELKIIINSVESFLESKYDETKRKNGNYEALVKKNRELAKNKSLKTQEKLLQFYLTEAKVKSLFKLSLIPLREVASRGNVAKVSVSKYKKIILNAIKQRLLILMAQDKETRQRFVMNINTGELTLAKVSVTMTKKCLTFCLNCLNKSYKSKETLCTSTKE